MNITVVLNIVEPLYKEGLLHMLRSNAGICCVGIANSIDETIELIRRKQPSVVIFDLTSLPSSTNMEILVARSRLACANTSVLIIDNNRVGTTAIRALRAGVKGYLSRDTDIPNFLNVIIRVSQGRTIFDFVYDPKSFDIPDRPLPRSASMDQILHDRELEILKLCSKGLCNKEIASELNISTRTVGSHFFNIFKKLRVASRTQAVSYAFEHNIFSQEETDNY